MSHESEFCITEEEKKKDEPFISDVIEGIHLVGLEDLCGLPTE